MDKRASKILAVMTVALLAGCLVFMFLPLLTMVTVPGEKAEFYGGTLLFGGTLLCELPSGVYEFRFEMNIGILIITQCYLLSGISTYLGANSRFNRVFSLVLNLGATIALTFVQPMVLSTSTLTVSGLGYGYGYHLCMVFAVSAFVLQTVGLILSFIPKKPA